MILKEKKNLNTVIYLNKWLCKLNVFKVQTQESKLHQALLFKNIFTKSKNILGYSHS